MKILYFVLASLTFSSVGHYDNQKVEVFTYWKEGDTQRLILKEGFVRYDNENIEKKDVTISNVEVEVLEETDSSYTIRWTYLDTYLDQINVEDEDDEIDSRIEEVMGKISLIYTTDEFGVYQGVVNMDEALATMMSGLESIVKEDMKDLGDDSEMFLEMMKELLYSEAMINEMDQDIWNYHYYLGKIFVPDTMISYEDVINTQYYEEAIPVNGTITISTDRDKMIIGLYDMKEVEEAKMTEAIETVVEGLSEAGEILEGSDLTNHGLSVSEIENYLYDYDYGWLKSYEKRRTSQSGSKRHERFVSIEEQ